MVGEGAYGEVVGYEEEVGVLLRQQDAHPSSGIRVAEAAGRAAGEAAPAVPAVPAAEVAAAAPARE